MESLHESSRGSTARELRAAFISAVRLSRTLCRCSAMFARVRKSENARTTSPAISVGRASTILYSSSRAGSRLPSWGSRRALPCSRMRSTGSPAASGFRPTGRRGRGRPRAAPHRARQVGSRIWNPPSGVHSAVRSSSENCHVEIFVFRLGSHFRHGQMGLETNLTWNIDGWVMRASKSACCPSGPGSRFTINSGLRRRVLACKRPGKLG